MRLSPWVRKIPWRRKWWPTSVFFPGKSQGQRRLVDYSPQGCKEWDLTEWVSTHACMDRDLVLHKPNLLPPVKQRKEANMCKHFLHRTSQGERNRRMCWEKPGCWGWPALPLSGQTCLLSTHPEMTVCSLDQKPGGLSDVHSPSEDNLVPCTQVISVACYHLCIFYCLPVVLLPSGFRF